MNLIVTETICFISGIQTGERDFMQTLQIFLVLLCKRIKIEESNRFISLKLTIICQNKGEL